MSNSISITELMGSWSTPLRPIIKSEGFTKLTGQVENLVRSGVKITPEPMNIFNAFKLCPYDDIKMVIIGQDPHPVAGEADGLAFSACLSKEQPQSLSVFLSGIEDDIFNGFNLHIRKMSCLKALASQGVLLLNMSLTTVVGSTGVHYSLWEPFIQLVLTHLNKHKSGLSYIFMGKKAAKFKGLVDKEANLVHAIAHPMTAYLTNGIWEHENVFSLSNSYLLLKEKTPIVWCKTCKDPHLESLMELRSYTSQAVKDTDIEDELPF